MSTPIIHHEAPADWVLLSRSIGTVPALSDILLEYFRGEVLQLVSAGRFFDFSANRYNHEICLRGALLIFNNGKMKIIAPEKVLVEQDAAVLREEWSFAMMEVGATLRSLVLSRRLRLHGRRSQLQSPFENVPIDLLDVADFTVNLEGNFATFPDGDRYLSVHVEVLDDDLKLEMPATVKPAGSGRAGKREIDILVEAMIGEAPEKLTKITAADLLKMSHKARRFEKIWSEAVVRFTARGIETTRPYGSPGRPKKTPAV